MKVAGIDYSTLAVDLVLLDEDTPAATWHRFPLAGSSPLEKARSLRGRFPGRSWFEDQGVYLVGIEDPFGRWAHTAKALGLICGAIAALLPPGLDVLELPPSEWFPEITGRKPPRTSDERKAIIWKEALARWPGMPPTAPQDAADAYAVAWAARAINARAVERGAA